MSELYPETQEIVGFFIADIIQMLGGRLRRAIARVANPRAGADPMADVELLLVVDELRTREMYRIWDMAGDATLKHETVFSVQAYSTEDFEQRMSLPLIANFISEGLEYDLQ